MKKMTIQKWAIPIISVSVACGLFLLGYNIGSKFAVMELEDEVFRKLSKK